MATYFWSDLHLNHVAILGFDTNHQGTRRHETVEAMNEHLIQRWNERVTDKDTVWVLGDFGIRVKDVITHQTSEAFTADSIIRPPNSLPIIFGRLRGHKHLILGNHDKRNKVDELPWESQSLLHTFKENGSRAILCHYPIDSWYGMAEGTLMLHGHCHGTMTPKRYMAHRFDVGADVWHNPIDFEQLLVEAKRQTFVPVDHHGDKAYHPDPPAQPLVGDSSDLIAVASKIYNRWSNTRKGYVDFDGADAHALGVAIKKAEGK